MDRTELQALIDRVIGKKGILRAPAYWVRRLLGNLMDYTDGKAKEGKAYTDAAVKNVKITVDSEMSDESENAVSNKAIKAYVDGKSYPVMLADGAELSMLPNTYYVFTGRSIALSLAPGEPDKVNEYIIKIVCEDNVTPQITMPSDIRWANGMIPFFIAGSTYVISIIDNLAVFAEFTTAS